MSEPDKFLTHNYNLRHKPFLNGANGKVVYKRRNE